ncbi:MAG: T9SS type A sorting domain-containing protein [Bacteroidetes bacterium]|nr:T9SS type A sorting domain-containing protein [Bacteroidota bacterium]
MKLITIFLIQISCIFFSNLSYGQVELWGMTYEGGVNNSGVIFKINSDGTNYNLTHSFSISDGINPMGSLIHATDGNFYGITNSGGPNNLGVMFRYDPNNNNYNTILNFDSTNGGRPHGSLIQRVSGALYGYTTGNGSNGRIFGYHLPWLYFNMHHFDSLTGYLAYGNIHENFFMYGLTSSGGIYGKGVFFKLNSYNGLYTVILNFDGINGANPQNGFMSCSDGKLYATTMNGGNFGYGTIMRYNPAINLIETFYSFISPVSGVHPACNLVEANNGLLYGMADGGINNDGIIFSLDTMSGTVTKVFDFSSSTSGESPKGSLINASDGKLYGMTFSGGMNGLGVIFKFDPSNNTYVKLLDFDSINGAKPLGDLIEYIAPTGVNSFSQNENSIAISPNPTSGQFKITGNGITDKTLQLRLTDILGRVIYVTEIPVINGCFEKSLSVEKVLAGIYFMNVYSGNWMQSFKIEVRN